MLRPILIRLSLLATCLLSLPLVAGFFGALHPAFDSFAHFRVHLAALMALAAVPLIASSFWKHGLMALLLGAAATVSAVGLPSLGVGPVHAGFEQRPIAAKSYRLLHLNLRYNHSRPERVLAMLAELQPDFVMLNEVSDMWNDRLRDVLNLYPYQVRCGLSGRIAGTAILSRHPFGAGRMTECVGNGSLAVAQVDLDGRRVDLAALHLGWPWPYGQSRQVGRLSADLASLGADALLAGDLNAVPWSRTARRMAEAGALAPMRSAGPSWLFLELPAVLRPWIGLPIDHVFAKGRVQLYSGGVLEDVGSDHLPILVEFGIRSDPSPGEQLTVLAGFADRSRAFAR